MGHWLKKTLIKIAVFAVICAVVCVLDSLGIINF